MDSTISTIQQFPLYRILSTMQSAPTTTGFNMSTIQYSPMWMRMMPQEAAGLSTVGLITNSQYLSTMNQYIQPIVVEAHKGLGSRLKALISGMCAAEETKREVRVIWAATAECGAKFLDLFQPTLPVWAHVHDQLSVGYVQHTCDEQAQWDGVKDGKSVVYLKSGSRFHTTADVSFVYWLKNLKPAAAIAAVDISGVVGVHLRGDSAPIIAAMQAMPAETKFFVASDSDAGRQALEAAFPGRVVTVAKNLTRNAEGLKDALKDFIALSKCSEIIASAGSSFSEMAALYGDVKLTVLA
jgi:hypothetical protein